MTRAPRTGLLRALSLSLAVLAASATTLLAQDPAPPPTPEATPAPSPEPKVVVGGWVDTYYGYNFNETDPMLRSFDVQHNAFSLSAAEVNLTKVPTAESRVGFRTDLWFGKAADLTASFEPEADGQEIYKHVQQAYVSVLTGKVQWDAGKFVTPIGTEVIESQDNWNYTRSILFGYAIPFYHLGVRATVPVTDKLSLSGYLVNGWNNAVEIDGRKTFAVGATLKPTASVTWVANYMLGKEAEDLDTRHLFDTTLTVAARSGLFLRLRAPRSRTTGLPRKCASTSVRLRWKRSTSISNGSWATIRSRRSVSSIAMATSSSGSMGWPFSSRAAASRSPSTSRLRTTFWARRSPPPLNSLLQATADSNRTGPSARRSSAADMGVSSIGPGGWGLLGPSSRPGGIHEY